MNLFIVLLSHLFLSNSLKISGSDLIIKKLNEYRVKTVFGYTGGANLKLFDSLYRSNIKTIINRNEQCCGFSAEGYSKSSGKLGVVITTSGPGLTNIITPLQDSYSDGVPLLAISGNVASNKIGTSAFQECDATALTKPCVKYNKLIKKISDLESSIDVAIQTAYQGRKGPVHLDICSNVFSEEIHIPDQVYSEFDEIYMKEQKEQIKKTTIIPSFKKEYDLVIEDYDKLKVFYEIFTALRKSEKPVLIVGQGCKRYYEEIRTFMEFFNIPTATTLHGLGIIDETNDLSLKMLGMHGSAYANIAIQNADLIIGLGYRFDDRTIGNPQNYGLCAKNGYGIVHIDISEEKIEEVKKIINPTYSLQIDVRDFLKKINNLVDELYMKQPKRYSWIKYIQNLKYIYSFHKNKKDEEPDMTIPYIITQLSNKLKDFKNYLITTGVGVHQMQVAQYFTWKYPNTIITSGSQGTMGVGVPFALGAQLANPDKLVICIDGDGSFMMTCQDLMTISEYNIPIKILIMDNQNLQMVSNWQDDFYEKKRAGSKLKNPNFVKLANSMGISSLYCNHVDEIDDCLNEVIYSTYPLLIHFQVKETKCLPFVAPGRALHDMIL
jgi:acetolactate synthase-1/2/3 large subunit